MDLLISCFCRVVHWKLVIFLNLIKDVYSKSYYPCLVTDLAEKVWDGFIVKTKTYISRILFYQGIGFSLIIFFTWFIEIFDSSAGASGTDFNWRETVLESVIVTIVAIPVMLFTKRLLSRLYHLEGFLRVCAWCKKLEHNDEWIPIETYFKEKFQTESSHGICPECYEQAQRQIKKPA